MTEETETAEQLKAMCVKMDEMYKAFTRQAEEKIKEQPLAYTMGAFIGGLITGYIMSYYMTKK